jgi:hypothetical protein
LRDIIMMNDPDYLSKRGTYQNFLENILHQA